jgi:hypothetical protein
VIQAKLDTTALPEARARVASRYESVSDMEWQRYARSRRITRASPRRVRVDSWQNVAAWIRKRGAVRSELTLG